MVSSVSCLYGIGNPEDFHETTVHIETGQKLSRQKFLYALVDALYSRNESEFKRGTFRVKGDSVDIFLAYGDYGCRVVFFGDEIETIETIDPVSGATLEFLSEISIYPANNFVTTKERTRSAIATIQDDMMQQCAYFEEIGKHLEAKRLKTRVEYDLEMIREVGYCPGIENYSRYFDGRSAGMRPFCLIDYFPADFLTFIDESHVTIPQIRAMSGGDRSRKQTLIEYGFRLPAAADNRPLRFDEFEGLVGQQLYVSATPGDYELEQTGGEVVEQVVRPTGLLDPPIDVRPIQNQIDDLLEEIRIRAEKDERVLVTTLTKRMAEELEKYLTRLDIRTRYIHSDVDTLERMEILDDFKAGRFDVLVGVNLLREGLDLPSVSLVAILDADKEGFLRSDRSLTQTAGRAARNVNGRVIMYADKITESMQTTIDATNRRRAKQMAYNEEHGIVPTQVGTSARSAVPVRNAYVEPMEDKVRFLEEDPVVARMNAAQLRTAVEAARKKMESAAAALDFLEAARWRDEMRALETIAGNRR